jgi:uncharacterized protein YbjT (DUF2867 family)
MILITGASGTVGRAALEEVRKGGAEFRAMYRDAEDAKKAPAGTATVVADFADKDSLRRALSGVNTVFLVCSPIPQLVALESNVIDVCKEKGIRHVALNSAMGAEDYPKSFPSWHHQVEEKLKSSGLAYTILRPNSFMQNIVAFHAPSIRAQGAFYSAMGNAKMSLIDVRDVGAATARVLQNPGGHAGKAYDLNGPEALTQTQIAEKISRVTGGPVKFVSIPEEAQRKAMLDQQIPEWLVTALLELQQYYAVEGEGGEVTDTLAKLLGRAPITLDQFLQENKDSFRGQAAGA